MNRTTAAALLGHWRRNPMQLFTLLAGLALATALWSGVQAINAEARASYDAAAATLGEGQYDQLRTRSGDPMPQLTYIALRRAGWLVSPVIEGRLNDQRIVGLDPLTAPGGLGPVTVSEGADITAFLAGEGQIFGTASALAALADLTDAKPILSPDVAPQTVITDIGVAQRLLGRPGEVDRVIVAPQQPQGQPELRRVAPSLTRQVAQGGSDVGRLTDSFHLNLTAFGLLSFAVGLFIVNGAIGLAFEQRRPVVRTLRALGVPLQRLVLLMAIELAVFALIAGLIGVALGYLIASLLLPDVAATLRGLYGAEVAGTLQLRPIWWLSGLAIALGGTLAAAAGAFWSLVRTPLLAGAHRRALSMSSGRVPCLRAAFAGALLVLAAGLVPTATGLIGGFVMLGALLIGAAIALPLLLDRILRAAERQSTSTVPRWFWADTRQQLPGLSLALMALLLAMSANVGVSTMVSSFRLTFVGFLDQRLASELYVSAEDAQQAQDLAIWLEDRVDAVLPIQSAQITAAGLPTEVFGTRDHATYRDNWVFLDSTPDAWDAVFNGTAVAVNEQLARRAGLWVGETVRIGVRDLPIAGVYGDYGNPIGQAVISEALFEVLYPTVTPLRFGIRMPAEEVPALVAELERAIGVPAGNTINQAGIKAFSLSIFDRTFTVTTALNILTLTVAGFAILMSLLTLATMRVPQLAPIWALGLTRRKLGLLEVVRAVMLAALTTVLAIPLGLALAWILLAVVNVAAFGWKLPMFVFPFEYLRLTAFALVAAVLAALWPARRLARTPVSDLLKVFSNER